MNYRNNNTPVHPLIVQLYRCELDDDDENGNNKNKDGKEGNAADGKEEEDPERKKKEKSPPDPIYRADEHDRQVNLYSSANAS